MPMVSCTQHSSISDLIQDQAEGPQIEVCRDAKLNRQLSQSGCVSCGSHQGVVKIFPDEHGARIVGKEGKWWIYFECQDCGYQTAWWKAFKGFKALKGGVKIDPLF